MDVKAKALTATTDFVDDHPGVAMGIVTTLMAAAGLAVSLGLWKYVRNDTKKMLVEVLKERR